MKLPPFDVENVSLNSDKTGSDGVLWEQGFLLGFFFLLFFIGFQHVTLE